MKSMLTAIMAVAVAVIFSAPSFAGEKKDEKKGGKFVEVINAEETFGDKKEEKKGGYVDTFGEKKDEKKGK